MEQTCARQVIWLSVDCSETARRGPVGLKTVCTGWSSREGEGVRLVVGLARSVDRALFSQPYQVGVLAVARTTALPSAAPRMVTMVTNCSANACLLRVEAGIPLCATGASSISRSIQLQRGEPRNQLGSDKELALHEMQTLGASSTQMAGPWGGSGEEVLLSAGQPGIPSWGRPPVPVVVWLQAVVPAELPWGASRAAHAAAVAAPWVMLSQPYGARTSQWKQTLATLHLGDQCPARAAKVIQTM